MSRRFIVCGNWKMNGDKNHINDIINNMKRGPMDRSVEVVVGVPALYLPHVKSIVPDYISVAAQNCWKCQDGAFTGEISPAMIADIGVKWVIIGQSERRTIFMETDELIAEKVALALETGLRVIVCFGETLQEKEAGQTEEVIFRQLKALVLPIGKKWDKVVLAYEPVWAIDTGKTTTTKEAQDTHKAIRDWLKANVSAHVAAKVRIQFGGPLTTANAWEYALCPDIDGFLVGVASLKPQFVDIINSTK